METSVAPEPSARTAFAGLVDYAGLFPPAKLAIEQAAREYREARNGPHAWMLGRFIIPVSVLASNPQAVDAAFSAIVDVLGDEARWFEEVASRVAAAADLRQRGARIEALEIALPASVVSAGELAAPLRHLRERIAAERLDDLPCYVEFTRTPGEMPNVTRALAAASGAGLRAKLRCGGVTAQAFPSVDEVADFIAAAAAQRVAFKATAGLHHPVRHIDAATGFPMHGFLNLLTAAALATRVSREMLHAIVAEEDAGAFTFSPATLQWRSERIDSTQLAAVRDAFIAYGSCSFSEPVEDLTALGMLATR